MEEPSRQPNSAAQPTSLEDRLRSLEESLAFAQRESDEALSQILAMDSQMRELVKRLAKVEAALARQAEQAGASDQDTQEPESPGIEP